MKHFTDKEIDVLMRQVTDPTQEELQEQKSRLDAQIKVFEDKYGLSSNDLKYRLQSGEIKETADICSWLIALKIRSRFESVAKNFVNYPRPCL